MSSVSSAQDVADCHKLPCGRASQQKMKNATIRDFMVKRITTKDESMKDGSNDGDKDLTSWFVHVPFVIKVFSWLYIACLICQSDVPTISGCWPFC